MLSDPGQQPATPQQQQQAQQQQQQQAQQQQQQHDSQTAVGQFTPPGFKSEPEAGSAAAADASPPRSDGFPAAAGSGYQQGYGGYPAAGTYLNAAPLMLYPHLYPGQLVPAAEERPDGSAAQYRTDQQAYSADWMTQQQQQMGAEGLDGRYRAAAGDPSVWRPYSWPSEHRQ